MKKIDLSKQDKELVNDVLAHWKEQGLLEESTVNVLRDNIDEKSFEWKILARYAFWIALASLIFAVFSLFADDELLQFISQFFDAPNAFFSVAFSLLAILFYYLGFRSKRNAPQKTFTSETLMLAGSFSTATSIGFLGQVLDRESHYYTFFFLLSILIYGTLAVKLQSKLIWIFTLVALGIWFATETASYSDWGWSFWGMNFPLRFTIFGALLTLFSIFIQSKIKILQSFEITSFIVGLLYTMLALWGLSIFGNYSSFDEWTRVRQYEIFYWGLLGIFVSLCLALYGLKKRDVVSRDIGFIFFLLNLYTRFVEYLWDNINRAIFFLLLAVSFWLVGRWSEQIWKNKSAE